MVKNTIKNFFWLKSEKVKTFDGFIQAEFFYKKQSVVQIIFRIKLKCKFFQEG
jgi:hypothetical protein